MPTFRYLATWFAVGVLATAALIGLTSPASATSHPPRAPEGNTIIWSQDFESPICNVWTRVQNHLYSDVCSGFSSNSRLNFPEDAGEGGIGDSVGHFVLYPGDMAANGHRTEVSGDGAYWRVFQGHDRVLQFALKVAADFQSPPSSGFMILAQLHAGQGSPPLVLRVGSDGSLQLASHGNGTVPDRVLVPAAQFQAAKGTYWNVKIHFVGSDNTAVGGVEGWAGHATQGTFTLPWASGRTMDIDDGSSYWKMGMYGSNYHTNVQAVAIDDIAYSANN